MSLIEILCSHVENSLGRPLLTPRDFTYLSTRIYERLHQQISPTTLKRIWGYQHDEGPSRISTLNILAQFCGYKSWSSFEEDSDKRENQSALILNRNLAVEGLEVGSELLLTWSPDRSCHVKYLGDHRFEILKAVNSKLQDGNTFKCDVFIENEPLYVYDLIQDNFPGVCYSAGRKDGIHFEYVSKVEKQ